MKQTLWQRIRDRIGFIKFQTYKLLRYGRTS